MKFNCKIFAITITFLVYSVSGYSQTVDKKNYQTASAEIAPVIDGLAKDECWNMVEWGGGFIQSEPLQNKPPSQETAFKILFDDNNLYVFIRAFDTEPDKISRIMSRRDNFSGDMVEINIDSYFDKQTAFSFTAMASGAKGDEAVTQNGNNWDPSWNPIWYLATSIDLRSPGLEFNDLGYMRYSDVIHHGSWAGYYIREPFWIFNNFHLNMNYWLYWDFSGRLLSSNANTNFNSQFKNRWRINGNFTRQSENIEPYMLRGGPSFTRPGTEDFNFNLHTDQSKMISLSLGSHNGLSDVHSQRAHESGKNK